LAALYLQGRHYLVNTDFTIYLLGENNNDITDIGTKHHFYNEFLIEISFYAFEKVLKRAQ